MKQDSLKKIAEEVRNCIKCRLYKTACKGVPGEGNPHARIILIGQAPGREEDKTGRPFVGKSGKYLTQLLKSKGIKRENIFITSIVKHYPPRNRPPQQDEINACLPYLLRQIKLVKPHIIVLLGRIAEKALKNNPLLKNKKVIATVHPAAALRFPKMRKKIKPDFAKIIAQTKQF